MPIDALSVLCAQLTRDLLAIAKFLYNSGRHCLGSCKLSSNGFAYSADGGRGLCVFGELCVDCDDWYTNGDFCCLTVFDD